MIKKGSILIHPSEKHLYRNGRAKKLPLVAGPLVQGFYLDRIFGSLSSESASLSLSLFMISWLLIRCGITFEIELWFFQSCAVWDRQWNCGSKVSTTLDYFFRNHKLFCRRKHLPPVVNKNNENIGSSSELFSKLSTHFWETFKDLFVSAVEVIAQCVEVQFYREHQVKPWKWW